VNGHLGDKKKTLETDSHGNWWSMNMSILWNM